MDEQTGFTLFMLGVFICRLFQFFCKIGKYAQGTFQDSVDEGNTQAVICHGYALVGSAMVAVLHFPFVEHATAAVDDEPVC